MGIQINGQTDTVTATDGSINVGGDVTIPSNITAVNGTFSGNVSIAGTLTYEDVTNIDSVGVITARNGIDVTSGSVGIGTDNPSQLLHLQADSAHQILLKRGGQYPSECKFSISKLVILASSTPSQTEIKLILSPSPEEVLSFLLNLSLLLAIILLAASNIRPVDL